MRGLRGGPFGEFLLFPVHPPAYELLAMTRPQIEFSIKIFIVLLIVAFGYACSVVLGMLGLV